MHTLLHGSKWPPRCILTHTDSYCCVLGLELPLLDRKSFYPWWPFPNLLSYYLKAFFHTWAMQIPIAWLSIVLFRGLVPPQLLETYSVNLTVGSPVSGFANWLSAYQMQYANVLLIAIRHSVCLSKWHKCSSTLRSIYFSTVATNLQSTVLCTDNQLAKFVGKISVVSPNKVGVSHISLILRSTKPRIFTPRKLSSIR